jgi:hypothetical protein
MVGVIVGVLVTVGVIVGVGVGNPEEVIVGVTVGVGVTVPVGVGNIGTTLPTPWPCLILKIYFISLYIRDLMYQDY